MAEMIETERGRHGGAGAVLAALAIGMAASPASADAAMAAPVSAPATPPAIRPWFLCDSIDQPYGYAVTGGESGAPVHVLVIDKRQGSLADRNYTLGRADPGAGNIWYPLSGGKAGDVLHAINKGMIDDPATATTPLFTSVTIDGRTGSCRWMKRTLFQAFTKRRSILVRRDDDGRLVYESFNYRGGTGNILHPDGVERTNPPSLRIIGGKGGGGDYVFANRGYEYRISAGASGGSLSVVRAGKVIQREPLLVSLIGRQ